MLSKSKRRKESIKTQQILGTTRECCLITESLRGLCRVGAGVRRGGTRYVTCALRHTIPRSSACPPLPWIRIPWTLKETHPLVDYFQSAQPLNGRQFRLYASLSHRQDKVWPSPRPRRGC